MTTEEQLKQKMKQLAIMLSNDSCTCCDNNYPPAGCPTCQLIEDKDIMHLELIIGGENCCE